MFFALTRRWVNATEVRCKRTMLIAATKVPSASPAAIERAKIDLDRRIGMSKLLVGEERCFSYGEDESETMRRTPDMVVLAENVDDVAATLEIAQKHGVPVTP